MMSQQVPTLFVDLDGTLSSVDTLHVTFRAILRKRPWAFAHLTFCWLLYGRAYCKQVAVRIFLLDASRLPYRAGFLAFLREERARGRRLYLATGADRLIAEAVAAHLGLFDGILASDGVHNNTGEIKLAAIRKLVGNAPFDYAGDSTADLPLFRAARASLLVGARPALVAKAKAVGNVERVFN
jgi:phosphoserine phosphatase